MNIIEKDKTYPFAMTYKEPDGTQRVAFLSGSELDGTECALYGSIFLRRQIQETVARTSAIDLSEWLDEDTVFTSENKRPAWSCVKIDAIAREGGFDFVRAGTVDTPDYANVGLWVAAQPNMYTHELVPSLNDSEYRRESDGYSIVDGATGKRVTYPTLIEAARAACDYTIESTPNMSDMPLLKELIHSACQRDLGFFNPGTVYFIARLTLGDDGIPVQGTAKCGDTPYTPSQVDTYEKFAELAREEFFSSNPETVTQQI